MVMGRKFIHICWYAKTNVYYYYKVPGPTHPFGFTTLQQSVTISTSWTRLKFIEIHWKDIDRNRGLSKSFQEMLCRFCLLFTICGALLFRSLGNSPQLVIQRFSMLKRDTFQKWNIKTTSEFIFVFSKIINISWLLSPPHQQNVSD